MKLIEIMSDAENKKSDDQPPRFGTPPTHKEGGAVAALTSISDPWASYTAARTLPESFKLYGHRGPSSPDVPQRPTLGFGQQQPPATPQQFQEQLI